MPDDSKARMNVNNLGSQTYGPTDFLNLIKTAWMNAGSPPGQITCSFVRGGFSFGFEPELVERIEMPATAFSHGKPLFPKQTQDD